jgi:hypothetical protein
MIQFYLYDELNKDEKLIIEEHLKSCADCKLEFESYQKLFNQISEDADKTVDEKLLFAARQELRGALRIERSRVSTSQKILNKIIPFLTKPIGLALGGVSILLIGIIVGHLFWGTSDQDKTTISSLIQPASNTNGENIRIDNIKFIDSDPSDGKVEFTYDLVKQVHLKGSVSNPDVQSILTYALLNEQNPGTRLNSLNVINASQTRKPDEEIKAALISVAKFDDNPGVRREAISSLKEFPADNDIKNALLYVLLNDSSSGVRIEAINSLAKASQEGKILSEKDLELLREKTETDNNNYIRFQAKNIIKEY